jgi:hypothetical protein
MVSANAKMDTAFESLRTPLDNEGNFGKVMFRIQNPDDKGDGKGTRTTWLYLNDKLSNTPRDLQVMFAIPYFQITTYQFYPKGENKPNEAPAITRNRPFHVFVAKQLSYPSQYREFKLDIGDLKILKVVGMGAFGTVFLGKIASTNKYYAVKML